MDRIPSFMEEFFHDFVLHDSLLIIDGDAVCEAINTNSSDCSFGGEYPAFASSASKFFKNLENCKVKPVVIFRGGFANKNLDEVCERNKKLILSVPDLHSDDSKKQRLQPLLLKEVFKCITRREGIKCFQTLSNSHGEIALIARALECPVLSNHLDFFIHGTMYISFDSLKDIIQNPFKQDVKEISCKMTKFNHVSQKYPKMNISVLPLAAILLENSTSALFEKLDVATLISDQGSTGEMISEKDSDASRTDMIFRWLSKQTLDTAVSQILSACPADEHQSARLTAIVERINKYATPLLTVFDTVLKSLEYPLNQINNLKRELQGNKPYQYRDLSDLKIVEEPKVDDETEKQNEVLNNLNSKVPWFIYKYKTAKFPAYFLDMLLDKPFVCRVQIEDFSHSTCINESLKIFHMIVKLLNSGTTSSNTLKYIARGKGTAELETYKLECDPNLDLPSLQTLNEYASEKREEILLNTLGVSSGTLQEFPSTWRLFIGTVKYWLNEADKAFVTKYHVYTLIFMMVFQVVKQVNKNSDAFTSNDVLMKVDEKDCKEVEPLFEPHKKRTDAEIDVTAIHAFESLKKALKHSMDLNALLGNPYRDVDVANFFSGIMMYNLYKTLEAHEDVDNYVKTVFEKTPTIFHLFCSVSERIYTKFPDVR